MSEWYQAFLILFLVFPAMLLVGAFRVFYSKSRFIRVSNFFLLWPAIMVCFWINIDLIHLIFPKILNSEVKTEDISLLILLKAHIRPIGLVFILAIIHHALEYINDWGGRLREQNKPNSCCFKTWIFKVLGCLDSLLCFFHKIVSHPWVGYIRHNRRIEILMADIFTEDNNLYMGRFIAFQENGSEVSMISIGNVFRFYPDTKSAGHIEKNSPSKPILGEEKYVSKRKQRLIKNSGHLLIPYSKVKTIHLWRLKTGTDMELNIYDSNSEELLKWYLSLMKFAPQVFTTFKIKVFLNNQDKDEFEEKLLSWGREYMIPDEIGKRISITYIKDN